MANLYFRNVGTAWDTATNWSLTNGGGATGTVPTSADVANFTVNSGNCTITNPAECLGLVAVGYLNTLTQNGDLQIGTSGINWGVGTFVGSVKITAGGGDVTILGSFTQTNGTFTAPKRLMTIYKDIDISAGVFLHGNGTVVLFSSNACTIKSLAVKIVNVGVFWNLDISKSGLYSTTITNNCEVLNKLIHRSGSSFTGADFVIYYQVEFLCTSDEIGSGGFSFSKPTNCEISGGGNIVGPIKINNASVVIAVMNDIYINYNFTYTAGTIDWGGNTAHLVSSNVSILTNATFWNLNLNKAVNNYITIAGSNTIVLNKLTVTVCAKIDGATFYLEVRGDIELIQSTPALTSSSKGIKASGGADIQKLSCAGFFDFPFTIAKSAGKVLLTSKMNFSKAFDIEIDSGGFDLDVFSISSLKDFTMFGGEFIGNSGIATFKNVSILSGTFRESSAPFYITGSILVITVPAIYVNNLSGGI